VPRYDAVAEGFWQYYEFAQYLGKAAAGTLSLLSPDWIYGVYTGLVGSSWKPFSPLNPPILGDFEDSVSPNLWGRGGETQQFEEDPEICIHGSLVG